MANDEYWETLGRLADLATVSALLKGIWLLLKKLLSKIFKRGKHDKR